MQRYQNIPNSFIEFDISPFIHEQDITRFTLTHYGKFPFDIAFVADQLMIYPKAKDKLPTFVTALALFSPQSYEQASSEEVALYKAGLISGNRLLDLSAGLGVDDWAFAKHFKHVDGVDIDAGLNKLVRKNYQKLGVTNIIRHDADAYDFVKSITEKFDWVYLDADRRVQGNRAYGLAETEPNILTLKEKLFTFTENVLLKVSPMLDLQALVAELQTVKHIWVLSVKNEVKEILVQLSVKSNESIDVTAVDLDKEEKRYEGKLNQQHTLHYNDNGNYFYEPALALIKAGLASAYLAENTIQQLAPNSVYGVSQQSVSNFFGRCFEIVSSSEFSKSKFSAYVKEHNLTKANIAKRNFKMEVDEIRKQFKLKDGGEEYLFFTENAGKGKLFFHCRKVGNEDSRSRGLARDGE